MDNIKVGIRVRPLLPRELEGGSHWVVSGNSITQKGVSSASYSFDYVFDESVDTETIFSTLAFPTIHSVMEGFNGTIFAYGQTSSGKTYTMTGTPMEPGIVPQTLQEVFNYVDQHPEREFIIRVSYLEIYNESLTDLLNTSNRDLKIREDPHRNVTVHGLTEQAVTGPEEIAHLLIYGEKNRSIGETNMNERSSRSHTLFTMTVESRLREGEEEDDGTVRVATLNLVDLAGSERVSATGAEGIRFKEGTFINLSLLVLGNVISKLSEGHGAHIPFRDSKLTRILQPSLGGNAKTCIICAITPAEIGETHSTLKFASRAKKVKNRPVVNEVLVGEEALLKKLKSYEKENEVLKKKLAQGLPEQEKQLLTEQLETSEKHKANLVAKIHSLEEIIVKSSSTVSDSAIQASKRRQTVCPGFLSRGVAFTAPQQTVAPAGPLSALKSEFTPRSQRRVTFASSPIMSPFLAHFDHGSFEKHLEDISPVVQEHCPTRFLSRPSFIPRNSVFLEDSEISTTSSIHGVSAVLVDSQVQTEDTMLDHTHFLSASTTTAAMCDAECQTDTMTPPRTSPAYLPSGSTTTAPMCDAECQTDTMTPPRTSPTPSVENISCSIEPAGQCTMVSAECQTDAGPERSIAVGTEDTWSERGRQCAATLVSTECQTVSEPSELNLDVCVGGTKPEGQCSQTVRLAPCVGPSHHHGSALESSICIHRDETKKTVEKMENMQFEFDEAQVRAQELQQRLDEVEQLLAVKESEVREAEVRKDAMATKLGDFEMASQAQEELLLMLQNRLKQANFKLQQAGEHTQKLEQALHESEHRSEEGSEQLLKRLTQAEEDSELQRQAVSKLTNQLQQTREKVTEKEAESRAWEERAAGLSQQLKEECSKLEEESEQAVKKLATQLEQAKQEIAEKEAESRAWEERVAGLSQQLKEASSRIEEESRQAVSELTTQLQQMTQKVTEKEAESRAWEERAAGLSQQLKEERSKLEESELQSQAVSKLTTQLEQARQEIAEKEAESKTWEERAAGLSQQLKEKNNEDESELQRQAVGELTTQLEQARQEVVEKEAESRAWEERAAGLSQQMKEEHSKELELQRQAVSELTTQLEQARQEITEKEAESKNWEERAAGLLQQLREERANLEEDSELQKQAVSELTTQLQQARQEIAEKEAESRAWEERAAGLSQQMKEEHSKELELQRQAVSELTTQLEQARQKVTEKEAESGAWEERAAGLSQQLKKENGKLEESQRTAASELAGLRKQLLALQQKLQPLPQDSTDGDSQLKQKIIMLTNKLAEAERMRKQDEQRFQRSYQQKLSEAQKACERVYALEELIETLQEEQQGGGGSGSEVAELRASLQEKIDIIESMREQPRSQATHRFYLAAVEKPNFSPQLRDTIREWPGNEANSYVGEEAELRVSLREKTQLIETMREQCNSTEYQLHTLQQEHEDYVSRMERMVRDLQQRLTSTEQLSYSSSPEPNKIAKLEAELVQAEEDLKSRDVTIVKGEKTVVRLMEDLKLAREEKAAISHALESRISVLRTELQESEAQLQHRSEEGSEQLLKRLTQAEEESELQRQAVSELTTQLQQMKQKVTEKEAESRAWEERAAGLSQQLKEERSKLEESELQSQAVSELTTQLEQAKQEIAKKEAESRAWEERAAGLSQQLKEERSKLEEDSELQRQAVGELTTQLEQARQKVAEKEAESRAWEERAAGLSQQMKEEHSKLEEESEQAVKKLATQLEQARQEIAEKEAESRAWEERADGLSQQLKDASSRIEEDSELQRRAVSELTTQLEQARQKVTEKEAESRAWEERVAGLSQQLRDTSSKLEENSELQRQAVRELTTQLEQARQEITEKEAESKTWEERAAGLSQQLKERNSKLEESELQKQAVSELTSRLEQARQEATKKEAESRAWEEKVTGLSRQLKEASSKLKERTSKLQRMTTTLQTVQSECATYKNMAEGYQEEYERATAKLNELAALEREFEDRRIELEEEIDSLNKKLQEKDVETQSLTEKLSELTNKLQVMESDYEKRSTVETTEQQLREVRKENARLKTKLQGQAVRPSSESVSVVTDGSGFVTGLALHQLKHEKSMVVRENDQLKTRMQKIKGELMAEKEKINKEREECKRYKQERNIYRAKYYHYKTECKCGIVVADISKEDPVSSNTASSSELPMSTTHSFAQPPAHNIPLEKLPSPKPPRKSIFSLKPDRDLRPGRRFFPKATSVAEPVITKPTVARRDNAATNDPENRKPLKPPGLVSGAVRQSNKFVWEQTLLETAKEAGPESQENCQHQ